MYTRIHVLLSILKILKYLCISRDTHVPISVAPYTEMEYIC